LSFSLTNYSLTYARLNPDMLQKQRFLYSTNRVEAIHLRTLRVVPKSKLYRRTYAARCRSVVLTDSLGSHKTAKLQAARLGYSFSDAATRKLAAINAREDYYKKREKLASTIKARFLAKRARATLRKLSKLSVK